MVHEYKRTIRRLWHSAPYWRYSVIAAGVFSLLALIQAGRESPSRPVPLRERFPAGAALSSDPLSEARWTEYEKTHMAAMKVAPTGARCEALVGALGKLTTDDLSRGRSPVFTSKARMAALADGERCRDELVRSDSHFTALHQAITAAEARPEPDLMQATAEAVAALDDFDRSRARFASEAALLAKGQALAQQLAASDGRIRELLQATAVFSTDHSGAVYIRLSEALKPLTDFDRIRLTREHPVALESANQAMGTLSESRTRLAKLFPLLSALRTTQTNQLRQQLMEVTAAITPFDEQVATEDQKAALQQARTAVQPLAWTLLPARVQALAHDASPDNVQAVVALYTLLKDLPGDGLSEPQRALLGQGREAADLLAASDTRLKALVTAAAGRQPNAPPNRRMLPALHAITPFDRARFQPPHTLAWENLSRAEAIIRGPEIGLTAENKGRVPIFVFSSGSDDLHRKVATTLQEALREARFAIAANRQEAALLADVTLLDAGDPQVDYSGPVVRRVSTPRLKLKMVWVADDSIFWSDQVEGTARGAQADTLRNLALLQAIDTLKNHLQRKIDAR
jgi:hypothetical protein